MDCQVKPIILLKVLVWFGLWQTSESNEATGCFNLPVTVNGDQKQYHFNNMPETVMVGLICPYNSYIEIKDEVVYKLSRKESHFCISEPDCCSRASGVGEICEWSQPLPQDEFCERDSSHCRVTLKRVNLSQSGCLEYSCGDQGQWCYSRWVTVHYDCVSHKQGDCDVTPDLCSSKGFCEQVPNNEQYYYCDCYHGFKGYNCEVDIDECNLKYMPNTCNSHQYCDDGHNVYSCPCIPGYTGIDCETDTDECASSPCRNNSICIDQFNGYYCECVNGFTDIGGSCECLNGKVVNLTATDIAVVPYCFNPTSYSFNSNAEHTSGFQFPTVVVVVSSIVVGLAVAIIAGAVLCICYKKHSKGGRNTNQCFGKFTPSKEMTANSGVELESTYLTCEGENRDQPEGEEEPDHYETSQQGYLVPKSVHEEDGDNKEEIQDHKTYSEPYDHFAAVGRKRQA